MSSQSQRADNSLGYAQSAALAAAASVASIFPGAVIPAGTQSLRITAETAAVRWRDDGTDPTTTVGYPLAIGAELIYTGSRLGALKFIGQTGTAIIDVVAYG